jgi:hypothetical protein
MRATFPVHLILFFLTLIICVEDYKLVMFSLYNSFHPGFLIPLYIPSSHLPEFYLNYTTTASFQIFSDSYFTSHPTI